MYVRCPICQDSIELASDSELRDITCSSCGSHFNLADDTTVSYRPAIEAIGHFQLVERVGFGHFGTVWKAHDTQLDRIVAIKIPRQEELNAGQTEQFLREARAAAQLTHPNIVSVHEIGRHDGSIYIVSDFVEGLTLGDWLTGRRPTIREAVELCVKIADALAHAHAGGIVHRDLKPSNIMLDGAAEPHLMDFGLAKREAGEITMTLDGHVLGTPAYMSPEQARGEAHRADRRSDIYSLGVILFELLTGERPFRGNARMLLHQVIHEESPSPKSLNAAIPRDLETICLKCLEKDPGRRYQTAAVFSADLRRFLKHEPIVARPIGPVERGWRWCRRNPALAALTSAVVVSLLAGTVISSLLAIRARAREIEATGYALAADAAQKQAREQAQVAEEARNRAREDARHAMELLEKNKELAGENAAHLYRSSVNNGLHLVDQGDVYGALLWFVEPIIRERANPGYQAAARMRVANYLRYTSRFRNVGLLVHDGAVTHFGIDPGGTMIVTACSDHTARIWNLRSGKPVGKPLVHLGRIVSASFSPDGRLVVTASEDGTARIWNATTGTASGAAMPHQTGSVRAGLESDGKPALVSVRYAEFNVDGSCLVTVDAEGAVHRWHATGLPIGPPLGIRFVNSARFEPSGRKILTAGNDGIVRVWDVISGEPAGPVFRHDRASGGSEPSHFSVRIAEFSPDGRWLMTIAAGRLVNVWDAATGSRIGGVLAHRDPVSSATFGPDGKWIVTASADGTAHVWEAATGQSVGPPLTHDGEVAWAVFSPDRSRIATASGNRVLVWDAATGTAVAPPLMHHAPVTCVRFTPDGYRIITASEDRMARIWELYESQPAGPLPAADMGEFPTFYDSKISDGSRSLRFSTNRPSVTIIDRDSRVLVEGPVHESALTSASFSPDGLRVATTSREGTTWIWDAGTGKAVMPAIRDVSSIAFSRDGHRFVTVSSRHSAQAWETATGEAVGSAMVHEGDVRSALFSPDGYAIVTASADRTVRVWEAATGRLLGPPLLHRAAVDYAGFESHGRSLITYCEEERWRWDVAPDERDDDDLVALARFDSTRSLDAHGEFQPLSQEGLDGLQEELRRRFPTDFEAAPPASVQNWHLRQTEDAESNSRWLAAAFHLSQLVAQGPPSAAVAIRHAKARLNAALVQPADDGQLVKLLEFPEKLGVLAEDDPLWWCCDPQALLAISEGRREKIIEVLSGALELEPRDPDWWTIPAGEALAVENHRRYQEICRQMLAYFPENVEAPTARRFLTIYVVTADLDADLRAALSRLETLVTAELKDASRIVGAARYREGKYHEALQSFQAKSEDDLQDEPLRAWDYFFLAMIQHRLGRLDESREHFRRGCAWIDGNPNIEWTEKMTDAELRRQAEALIAGK